MELPEKRARNVADHGRRKAAFVWVNRLTCVVDYYSSLNALFHKTSPRDSLLCPCFNIHPKTHSIHRRRNLISVKLVKASLTIITISEKYNVSANRYIISIHGKTSFAEISKNLGQFRSENNFIGFNYIIEISNMISNVKSFDIFNN